MSGYNVPTWVKVILAPVYLVKKIKDKIKGEK
jgi:hypothetical protein